MVIQVSMNFIKMNSFKIVILLFLALFSNSTRAQKIDEQHIVDLSLEYLCDSILDSDEYLSSAFIKYSGKIVPKYSSVYDVANCTGEIDFMTYPISNKELLDSLDNLYNSIQLTQGKANIKCKKIKKCNGLFKKKINVYRLYVYYPILYNSKIYNILYFYGSNIKVYICVEFNLDYVILGYYTKSYSV